MIHICCIVCARKMFYPKTFQWEASEIFQEFLKFEKKKFITDTCYKDAYMEHTHSQKFTPYCCVQSL